MRICIFNFNCKKVCVGVQRGEGIAKNYTAIKFECGSQFGSSVSVRALAIQINPYIQRCVLCECVSSSLVRMMSAVSG